jgi:hypothetical protein
VKVRSLHEELPGASGPVLLKVIGLVAFTTAWWFTMWLLLAGKISGLTTLTWRVGTA